MFQDAYPTASDIDRFILEVIDTVPHLEGLLLLWRSAPKPWTAEDIARQLYVSPNQAGSLLDDLLRRGLISRGTNGQSFFYDSSSEPRNCLIRAVDITYRRELIRISGMIHSKPSAGVRAFADAFRFRKDKS